MLDLSALVASGCGDVPLIRLPLRCNACERPGHRVVLSGRANGTGRSGGGMNLQYRHSYYIVP